MSANVTELVAYVPPPSPEVDVYSVCARIEQWAATADDVFLLKDNKAKLSAYDSYLAQMAKDGRAQISATVRRLEIRIGDLLGEPQPGRRTDLVDNLVDPLTRLSNQDKTDFRKMAANADVVEDDIARSTDENPASRAKVLAAIKEKENPVPTDTSVDRSPDAVALRVATAREMAEQGHTSKQIAARLGIAEGGMDAFRKRHGIEVPADKFAAKKRTIDSNRIVEGTVDMVRNLNTGLKLVAWSDLDIDNFDEWIVSLKAARRALYTLIDNLEKEKTRRGSE